MNTAPNLEDRLRAHYGTRAAKLRLAPMELDGVLARVDATLTPTAPAPRRNPTWLVAAALVGGAALGAGAIGLMRDQDSSSSVVPQTALAGPRPAATGCPDGPIPANVGELDLPNDVRVSGMLLPAVTPSGFCANDHQVTTHPAGGRYTVWASCAGCARPTAAVGRVEVVTDYDMEGDLPFDEVDVDGHEGRLYGPADDMAVSRMFVDLGAETAMFVGWGLDTAEFTTFAAGVVGQGGAPADVGDMAFVFNGDLGQYLPSSVPMAATLGIGYFDNDGIGLAYRVLKSSTRDTPVTPPLEAYAWARPNPVFATVDGRPTVTFPASPWYDNREQTAVIIQIDEHTQVMWTSNGTPPVASAELAAIELTPAQPDDPRWLEIAYESGQYDAQG